MVIMDLNESKDIKKGESATSGGRSEKGSDSPVFHGDLNDQVFPDKKFPLDINIDSDTIDELSKNPNIVELSNRTKLYEKKN